MNEEQFKTHAEKEFWEKVYLAATESGDGPSVAKTSADDAVAARRHRMGGLMARHVKPA